MQGLASAHEYLRFVVTLTATVAFRHPTIESLATVIVDPAARRMTLHSNGPCGGVHAVPLHAASV